MYNLMTKESRLNSQTAQFESLIKQNYIQEVYKGLNIFTNTDNGKFCMKVFKNAASHCIAYYHYRSLERMNEAKQQYKDSFDRGLAYKAELKANPTKSSAANCSTAVKEELKSIYPGIKFSVTSSNFAGGNSVDVHYQDGPTTNELSNVISKYQYGHFNGMEDIYEYTNDRKDIPQAKYVHSSRSMSETTKAALLKDGETLFNSDHYAHVYNVDNFIYQIFAACSIPEGATVTGIESTGETCGLSTPATFYKVAYTLPEGAKQTTTEPNFTPVPVVPGNVQIIDYSEKAIAVIGDTTPIKDKLKDLGGRFNYRLSCGPGWIFPKTKLETLKQVLSQPTTLKDEVKKTIEFLAETDLKIYGEVTEGTKEAAMVQNVDIETYDTLEDIEAAAKGGKVISLCNLGQLVNKAKP